MRVANSSALHISFWGVKFSNSNDFLELTLVGATNTCLKS